MNATTGASRRLHFTLAAVLLAAFALPMPAAAQGASNLGDVPAEKFLIAPGGVDLRTGRYAYRETDLTGGGEQGALGLTRIMPEPVANHANPFGNFSHNWDIFLIETPPRIADNNQPTGYETIRMSVHRDGRALTFESSSAQSKLYSPSDPEDGFTFKSDGQTAFLTFSPTKWGADSIYTMRGPDGTLMVFRRLGGADCADHIWQNGNRRRCAFISELTEPDGTKYSFDYVETGGVTGNRARLSRVTSSRGYALFLEGSGSLVTRACILNLALGPVPAPGGSCPASALATATYSYAGGKLVSATPPAGGASTFNYGPGPTMGFVKPGQTTPWLTNRLDLVEDEEFAMQEMVTNQSFVDGQTYAYAYDSRPITPRQPYTSISGGMYTDADGRQAQVRFGFPKQPGSEPMPTQPCTKFPCNDVAPDDFPDPIYQRTPGPDEIVDPLGRKTVMDYCDPRVKDGLPAWETNRCEVIPLQTSIDPEGIRTHYEYDGHGNVKKTIRTPKPGVLNPDGSTPAPIVLEAEYDYLSLKSQTKPLWSRDANGNVTRWTYAPEHGGVLTETGPAVGGVVPRKRFSYVQRQARLWDGSAAGPPVWLLDRISTCRTGNPSGAGCALGAADEVVTIFDYGLDSGPTNLLLRGTAVTADGQTLRTCYAYDSLGRKISETSPNGTTGLAACPALGPTGPQPWTTSLRYDSDGKVMGTIAPDPDGAGPLRFAAVRNSYDPAGRLVMVEQGELAGWQPEWVAPSSWPGFHMERKIDREFDALDRKTREWVSKGYSVLTVTEYSYDLSGRPRCTAVRMNPDHWSTPLGDKCVPGPAHPVNGPDRITRNVYDAAGRPTESWDGVGTPLARREALYTYNGNDQKTSLTDARGFKAEMAYDGHGRQSRWIFPSKTTPGVADASDYEQYGYDPNGNRTSLRKRDGSVLGFWYDALNRMTAKIVPERSGLTAAQTRDVHYEYDLRGLQTKARFDHLAGEGVTTAYDGFGRAVSSTLAMAGTSRTIGHLYDGEGNRIRITHPDGAFFPYDYDGLGRFLRVGENGPDTLVAFSYDYAGHRSGLTSGGMSSAFAHDPAGRPVSLAHDLAGTRGDQVIGLAYNPASQIASRAGSNDAYAWTGSVAVSRDYGTNGQNQYTGTLSNGAPSATFAYDLNGNLTSDGSTGFVYDVENRLVSASGEKNASLVYDPLGRLFQTSGGVAGVTRFLYDDDALVAEYNSAGTMVHRYIHGAGKGVDDPLIWYDNLASGWRRPLIADQQGSIIAVADMHGNPIAINTYDEYGIPGAGNQGRFQYTGQAWIPELGMYYYKARFYSPTLGRFLQVDPIGYDDQINLYTYVGNDPLNRVDPAGTEGKSLWTSVTEWASEELSNLKDQVRRIPDDLRSLPGHVANGTTGLPPTVSGGANLATAPIRAVNAARLGLAARTAARIGSRATSLAKQAGKNSVTLRTPGGFSRVDLAGKSHYSKELGRMVPTPHVQSYRENIVNGIVRSVSAVGDAVPATMKDLDKVADAMKARKP